MPETSWLVRHFGIGYYRSILRIWSMKIPASAPDYAPTVAPPPPSTLSSHSFSAPIIFSGKLVTTTLTP